jgi:nicotinamide-nucleotide amidase
MDEGSMNDAERIAAAVKRRGWRIATAESLTVGKVASALGAATDASEWFCGGVVAYATDTKQRVLGVSPGPVVSARCADEMVLGVLRLTGADAAVSTTGAGGPEPQDGRSVGTVFIAVRTPESSAVTEHHFDGPPGDVVSRAAAAALRSLADALDPTS